MHYSREKSNVSAPKKKNKKKTEETQNMRLGSANAPLVTFTTILVVAVPPITNRNCFHFFQKVCLFFGALACNLLIFILVPILGWIFLTLGASILVYLLYGSYRMIFKFCQENLKSISNWFRQKFQYQSSSQLSSQTSNGSPMLTPNVTEKQMTELESV